MTDRVVVVGGGIAGLSTAYRLVKDGADDLDVVVLESGRELGGKIRGAEVGGIELEAGPDSLLARKPWAVQLCEELGLGDDLTPASTGITYIWTEAGLVRFPSGPFGISTDPVELWRWPGMSRKGKIRAGGDLIARPRRDEGDESLGRLLRRRIGDEATDALVAPLLGGLFAGDVDRLSVAATFPELGAWERDHGSLMRGARTAAKAGRAGGRTPPPMFLRLKGGLRRLTASLAETIGADRLRLGAEVKALRATGDGFRVSVDGEELAAAVVVLTTPAFVTADLVERFAAPAARELRGIPYASTAVVLLVYPEGTGHDLPDSSGFVAPRGRLAMNAATLVSRKWPDASFGDRAVVRCFVGGMGVEDVVDQPDDDIVRGVSRQLAALLPLPEVPEAGRVVRWPRAMPQYEVGHLERVAFIEGSLPPGLYVVGQAYRGAGIPDCVKQANEVVARIRGRLAGEEAPDQASRA